MTQSSVRMENVFKSFDKTDVISSISLDIERGEFFSLLGPSGCGKTTLLRILGGFEAPTSGHIYIDGQDVTGLRAAQRPTNMVFQSYAIFPHLTVAQNVGFGLQHESISGQERKRRVSEAIEMVKLTGFEERRPDQLSGGQRQRASLARAIVKQPKVLLLDEPLSALDKNLREQMQTELHNIQRELKTTFVFVTHDQQEALFLSDRIAVMNEGRIAQTASPHDIYHSPQDRFVAEFVGTMNFLRGKVIKESETGCLVEVPGFGKISCRSNTQVHPSQTVTVGIRPESLELFPVERPGIAPANLRNVSQLGEKIVCSVEVGGALMSVTVFSRDKIAQLSTLSPGSNVWISIDDQTTIFQST